jgi:CRP/FNR family cyclic AMP-dependent transcriptional regulator
LFENLTAAAVGKRIGSARATQGETMDESHLKAVPLFGSLAKRELRAIAHCADELNVEEGRKLVREGEFSYEFFAIVEGAAEVIREGDHVADLGPGDFMGEMGLLTHDRRNATVVARSPMTVIVMTGPDFRNIEHEMPSVAARVRSAMEERSRALVA